MFIKAVELVKIHFKGKEFESEIKFQEFPKVAEIWVCKGWWVGEWAVAEYE
jgi:hypothetical protein